LVRACRRERKKKKPGGEPGREKRRGGRGKGKKKGEGSSRKASCLQKAVPKSCGKKTGLQKKGRRVRKKKEGDLTKANTKLTHCGESPRSREKDHSQV